MSHYIPVITPEAVIWVGAASLTPEERSLAASHLNHARAALGLRGVERLGDYEGVEINDLPLASDLDALEDLDAAGALAEIDVFYLELPE